MMLVIGVLLAVGMSAFTAGIGERVSVSGEVTSVSASGGDEVIVTLKTDDGAYTVRLSENEITSLDIQSGQSITVTGLEIEDEDGGMLEVEARSITIDGVVYALDDDDDDVDDDDENDD